MLKAILHTCLIAIIANVAISCNNDKPRDWDEIAEDGTLYVAIDYSPSGFYRQGDSISGLQYKMVEDMCKDFGIKPKFRMQNDLKKALEGLEAGKYDMIASLIPITSQLKNKIAFTKSLTKDKQVLVQRKKKDGDNSTDFIKNQLQLPGHCISMPEHSPYIVRLKNLGKEIGDSINIERIEHYQSEQLIILIAMGDMDYTVCEEALAKRMAKNYPQIDYGTPISFSQMQAWAVHQNTPNLLKKINEWIDSNATRYIK